MTHPDSEAPAAAASTGRVITISAVYGAGGSVIAPAVAARLSLPFHDRLVHVDGSRAAEDTVGVIHERLTAEEQRQSPAGRLLTSLANLGPGLGLPSSTLDDIDPRRHLRQRVEESVARIAGSHDGGVILGRAAAVVLGETPRTFHVRLFGPLDRCRQQGAKIEDVTDDVARVHQAESDRAWMRFVTRLFDRDPGDPRLYHLMLDSTIVPLERCVDVIAVAATAAWAA